MKLSKSLRAVLSLAAAAVFIVTAAVIPACAEDSLTLSLETDKKSYSAGEDIIVSLEADNNGIADIGEITIRHIAPEGYSLPEQSELTGYLSSGSRLSLRAVYPGSGGGLSGLPLTALIIAVAAALVIAVLVIAVKKGKGKGLGSAVTCLALAASMASGLLPGGLELFSADLETKELSCTVLVDGKETTFKAEVTLMKSYENSKLITIADTGWAAPIYVNRDSSAYDGLSLIAEAYADDIEALCGSRPEIVYSEPESGLYIAPGVVDDEYMSSQGVSFRISPSNGDFKSADWERYEIKVVEDGGRTKVLIAGADKRGAIYGIFHMTQDIFGVSPWIWWADVKPEHRDELSVSVSELETLSKRPSVNFRGFFMNDENPCLNGFADSHFGGLNYMFYDEIFKLILRLKGNYMWPAMWSNNFSNDGMEGVTGEFAELEKEYHYKLGGLMYVDQPGNEGAANNQPDTNIGQEPDRVLQPGEYPMTLANAVLADRYGITVGASHHEPMARSGGEWGSLQAYWGGRITYTDPEISTEQGQKVWNYLLNPNNLETFWSDAIYRNGSFDNLFTIGMRGENDSALVDDTGRTLTTEENIELLKAVLRTQDRILTEHGLGDTPSLIAVYKEVENCWYGGSRSDPDSAKGKGLRDDPEVTELLGADTNRIVMLCEDNNGYLRTMPELDERDEFNWGLYYHVDYVGSPKTSMWINTMPLQRSWENLTTAYEYGVDDAWILNVGDLRPMELPLSFFMDLAYDFEKYGSSNPNCVKEYQLNWVRKQFAAESVLEDEDLDTISQLLYDYTWLNGNCKPETLKDSGDTSYSILHYNDAANQLALVNSIIERADRLLEKLGADSPCYIPYYQLVYYPAVASANVVRIQIMSGINNLYAQRSSTLANTYERLINEYLDYDEELSAAYCSLGEDLNGLNKWYGMMIASPDYCRQYKDPVLGNVKAQAHMNYSSWNGESAVKIVPQHVEGENDSLMILDIPTEKRGYKSGTAVLDDFESTQKQKVVVNLTNGGTLPVEYTIECDEDFILIDGERSGSYEVSASFAVSIDWDKLDKDSSGVISVNGGDRTVKLEVNAKVIDTSSAKGEKVHFASNGIISMNSCDYSDKSSSGGVDWTVLEGYGKSRSSVKMLPSCTKSFKSGEGPWIEYSFVTDEPGDYKLIVYAGQGNNVSFDEGTHLNAGFSVDGGEPLVLNIQGEGYVSGVSGGWYAAIEQGGRRCETSLTLEPGQHTIRVYGMDQNLVINKLVLLPADETLKASLIGPLPTYNTSLGEVSQAEALPLIITD